MNPDQYGFRPTDSCMNQLIAITHLPMKYWKSLIVMFQVDSKGLF